MSLAKYKQKRSFDQTTEPTGGKSKSAQLTFVIQKHDASRLHYDFRLEMDGVLKSWAVPKGPSTDPSVKRLAMMVEDHPYDYKDFEGIIPEGNYGAGTVIVWDQGTYEPIAPAKNKADAEKILLKDLRSGSLKFILHGSKLKGEFALVHIKGKEENAWLLIKHNDKFAKTTEITAKDKSVVSGKSIAKMAKTPDHIYGEAPVKSSAKKNATKKNTGSAKSENTVVRKKSAARKSKVTAPQTGDTLPGAAREKTSMKLPGVPRMPFPKTVSPMLATLVDKPFNDPGWSYEIKWDGYRAIALCQKNKLELISRNNKSFNTKFYPVYDALKAQGFNAVLDGEIVVLNESGASDFGALQNWRSEADGDLIYYVFDLLWLNGHNLMEVPFLTRRKLLSQLLHGNGIIRESRIFQTSAEEFLAAAGKMGLEGIIAKRSDSIYVPGERSRDWLKLKISKRHEVVIGGFTQNDDSPKAFSALLVGVYEKGRLQYTGKIGTGFSDKLQKEMMAKFKPLITKKSPFGFEPDVNKPSRFRPNPPHARVFWLRPKLVCEVSYTEMTTDQVMRHPSFEGLRTDKNPGDVHAEKAQKTERVIQEAEMPLKKEKAAEHAVRPKKKIASKRPAAESTNEAIQLEPVKDRDRKTLLNPADDSQVRKVNGHDLKFSNLDKIFWPKEGYTKRDLLNYYYQVASFIVPYLKDRPQSLNRFPNGINGKSFYFKDVTATAPGWIKQFPYTTGEGEHKNFLVAEGEASLLWMANMGSIEMNPWNSTIKKPDHPDWCIIDIDPTERNSFEQVIETARVTHDILESLGVPGYCKTSGSTGIHIYIPMGAKYTYDECQLFGKLVATQVHNQLPDFTSIERMTVKRKGKIYVDYLQNRPKATLAAPYAVRPKPGATVSMPVLWDEVKKGLRMDQFTIKNVPALIKERGDLFKPVLGKGIDLKKILKSLQDSSS